jgi:hypothetical protein
MLSQSLLEGFGRGRVFNTPLKLMALDSLWICQHGWNWPLRKFNLRTTSSPADQIVSKKWPKDSDIIQETSGCGGVTLQKSLPEDCGTGLYTLSQSLLAPGVDSRHAEWSQVPRWDKRMFLVLVTAFIDCHVAQISMYRMSALFSGQQGLPTEFHSQQDQLSFFGAKGIVSRRSRRSPGDYTRLSSARLASYDKVQCHRSRLGRSP